MAVANNNTVDSLALVVGNTQVETPVVIAPSAIRHDQEEPGFRRANF